MRDVLVGLFKRKQIMIYRSTLLGFALVALLSFNLQKPEAKPNNSDDSSIQYLPTHSATAKEVVSELSKRHFNKRRFDDLLSAQFLDAYLQRLDGNKSLFLKTDITDFDKYRYRLDDTFRAGNLSPGFQIFNLYQRRLISRLETTIEQLPALVNGFDFSKSEYLNLEPDSRDWPTDAATAQDIWRKQIKNSVLGLQLAGKENKKIIETLQRRFENQLNRVKQYNANDVFQLYVNALTELYDPHTNYLSPRVSENFNISMSLSLEGIGAVLQIEDEFTKVVRLVHAGPADKQGELQPADRIVGVGQGKKGAIQDVVGWRLDEVVELIRGPKDSYVRLEVIPVNAEEDKHTLIQIQRNTVKLEEQSAKKSIVELPVGNKQTVKVGVIEVPTFYNDFDAMQRGDPNFKSTTRDVKKILDELILEGVEGIVMDLRDNGGGSLQEANDLTGLFIEQGPTVQIKHSSNRLYQDGKRRKSPYYDGPLVVLINRLSASASEIFAGAIQDYQRGIVVGSQSFGKGTVQSLTQLKLGQLKVTESKFYRVSGESTQHRGVIPDIEFPDLYDKEEIGESSLDRALPWDQISQADFPHYFDIPSVLPGLQEKHTVRIKNNADFIYLNERISLLKDNDIGEKLSLNENERKASREKNRKQLLDIENKRRKSKGELLLTDLEDDSDSKTDSDDKGEESDTDDPLITEAAHILLDALPIYQPHLLSNSSVQVESRI